LIEETLLYNGEIILEFNSANHQYRVINKGRRFKVPSVTRITSIVDKSGPLIYWASDNTLNLCKNAILPGTEYSEIYLDAVWKAARSESQRIKSEAGKRGTHIHVAIESLLKSGGVVQGISSEADEVCKWLQSNCITVTDSERKIYSRRHRYSGTLDAIGTIEDKVYLLDWKTSKHVYPEFRLQTAAYVAAYEEEFPSQKIEGRYIVQIAEDGTIHPHYFPRSTYRLDFKGFLGAKALFEQVQLLEKNLRKL
jgi:hypothetical protein